MKGKFSSPAGLPLASLLGAPHSQHWVLGKAFLEDSPNWLLYAIIFNAVLRIALER